MLIDSHNGPSINYVHVYGEGGIKPLIHFQCILHVKGGEVEVEGAKLACKIVCAMEGPKDVQYAFVEYHPLFYSVKSIF